jgi:hypothetical protein
MKNMKRTIFMLAITALVAAGTSSCKKEKMPKDAIHQTINISLRSDETYNLDLPMNKRNDEYRFKKQAAHFSTSELGQSSTGLRTFKYVPASGYTGTDQVILSNDWEREEHHADKPHGGGHHGDCDKEEEDHYIITVNIVVEDPNTVRSK